MVKKLLWAASVAFFIQFLYFQQFQILSLTCFVMNEDMSITSETDDRMTSKVDMDSPDEVSGGESVPLKKGPWTSAEDAILVDYVMTHGEGNWNAVQRHSGLARCGKSCRLRWANHLRPDLKKGAFTPEEEQRILELHAKMGNKWARMAIELPGRTDNEIKNYWNTRTKRRQRAGLPVYPPEISFLASQNKQNEELGAFSSADAQNPNVLGINNFEIPAVEFKNLEYNHLLYPPPLGEIPVSSFLAQGHRAPYSSTYFLSPMHPSKRIRGSESMFSGSNGDILTSLQYQNDGSLLAQPSGFSSYSHNLTYDDHRSFSSVLPGSHACLNGNSSSSEPTWAMKLDLPSLQNQTENWGSPPSPLPSLESANILIQSPPAGHSESGSLSPSNSGLLDAVLYESQTMKASNDNSHQGKETSGDAVNNSCPDLKGWETYEDPISPLSRFSASVFSEYAPVSESSLHEFPSMATMPGCKIKQEIGDLSPLDEKDDTSNQTIFSSPNTQHAKNHLAFKDAFGSGFFDDCGWDCKQTHAVATSSGQACGHNSCSWDAMSAV
ncbi:Transcription regulatory protein SNF2 [Datura stramonium]|uniref:Transcription regulatory protein SNF2 n=1 Tax=Datura stramonium TaxID=4076 RepID=A0ABS8TNT3_DATST|nr:Transcription regulatory protein SNF2 [Datura stramonium]